MAENSLIYCFFLNFLLKGLKFRAPNCSVLSRYPHSEPLRMSFSMYSTQPSCQLVLNCLLLHLLLLYLPFNFLRHSKLPLLLDTTKNQHEKRLTTFSYIPFVQTTLKKTEIFSPDREINLD